MKLKDFMELRGWSCDDVAKLTGTNRATVFRWCEGQTIPRQEDMAKIVEITKSAVMPNDFYLGDIYGSHQKITGTSSR